MTVLAWTKSEVALLGPLANIITQSHQDGMRDFGGGLQPGNVCRQDCGVRSWV